jgi:hypothetical protein
MNNIQHLMQFIPESQSSSKYDSNLFYSLEANFTSNSERRTNTDVNWNRMLRRIPGLVKRYMTNMIIAEYHTEEIYILYSSPQYIHRIKPYTLSMLSC